MNNNSSKMMHKIEAGRLATGFDVAALVKGASLVRSEEWNRILEGDKWSSWTGAALMSHDGHINTLSEGPKYRETDLVARCAAFANLFAFFKCPLRRVRIMSLSGGGGTVHTHRDQMPDDANLARLHLPLTGAALTDFSIETERIPMNEGELWYVDVTQPHSVVNRGAADRLTIVFDCELNDWLHELIVNSYAPGLCEPDDESKEAVLP